MTVPQNHLEITGRFPVISVKVDGKRLSCTRATLELDAESVPALTVSLPVVGGAVVTLDGTVTRFAEETRAALVAMGWTPPGGAS